jgi:hypothetical protein
MIDEGLLRRKYQHIMDNILYMNSSCAPAYKKDLESLFVEVWELHAIYIDSPDTSSNAFNKAKIALKINEEMTFTDEEIDDFLPKLLRKKKE